MGMKQIFFGNILLVVCCAFYLLWWILVFRPEHTARLGTGMLLIPAAIAGVTALILIIQGVGIWNDAEVLVERSNIISGKNVFIIGIFIYFLLLVITGFFLKRTVTTELLLIVGWGMLTIAELNAIFLSGMLTYRETLIWMIITLVVAAVSMICYLLYYNLPPLSGYIDGMIPLGVIGCMMLVLTIVMQMNWQNIAAK